MRTFVSDMNIFMFVAFGTPSRRPLQDKKAKNIRNTDFCTPITLYAKSIEKNIIYI